SLAGSKPESEEQRGCALTLDTLVALVGVLLVAYQIMPRSRQLALTLHLRFYDWLTVALASAGVIYLQFYSFFGAIGLSPHLGLNRWKLSPARASFGLVLMAAIILGLHLRWAKLGPRRIERFRKLVDELLWSKSFPELFALLEYHLTRIGK